VTDFGFVKERETVIFNPEKLESDIAFVNDEVIPDILEALKEDFGRMVVFMGLIQVASAEHCDLFSSFYFF